MAHVDEQLGQRGADLAGADDADAHAYLLQVGGLVARAGRRIVGR
jgi:hypothetical protein